MDIQYAILSLLSAQPLSGYDLKKKIAESDLFYWTGNNNQIYNSLVQLHNNGLVSQQVHEQDNLPARKVYSITQPGLDQLRQWAAAAPELTERRRNFLIQLAGAGTLPTGELLRLLDEYAQEVDIQLRMKRARSADPGLPAARSPRERYLWEQIDAGLLAEWELELNWVSRVRKEIAAQFQTSKESEA